MPYRTVLAGEMVFVRATVLHACSDTFQLRIEDFPKYSFTIWAPVSEIARAHDIGRLLPSKRPAR